MFLHWILLACLQVVAATKALYTTEWLQFPQFDRGYSKKVGRDVLDIFDFLHYAFCFQVSAHSKCKCTWKYMLLPCVLSWCLFSYIYWLIPLRTIFPGLNLSDVVRLPPFCENRAQKECVYACEISSSCMLGCAEEVCVDEFKLPQICVGASWERHFSHYISCQCFQKDNVSNQREHLVLLLANAETRADKPCNGAAPHNAKVFGTFLKCYCCLLSFSFTLHQ